VSKEKNICVIGLGYVGLPLALEFSKKYEVVGFDVNQSRIEELINGYDRTNEVDEIKLNKQKSLRLTHQKKDISDSNIYIITVPTPVDKNNKPDLKPLISASKLVGKNLQKNNIVIYESTVFPGCTEEVCVPILEEYSKLRFNIDFFCGYSPERINPGDREHTLTKIKKVTSGSNSQTLDTITELYNSIISAGTYKAKSIAVAEAAKVIENTQRDVNIALINELSIIFNKLNIDTEEVLEAASTKWNFLPFKPGLVGGHCIGVDPYYIANRALEVGYHPEIILAGRRINDNMGHFIVENTISILTKQGINPIGANVAVLGLTFKENCPDLRNTKVSTIIERLRDFKINLIISDEWAEKSDVQKDFKMEPKDLAEIEIQDAIIIAVGHKEYIKLNRIDFKRILKPGGVLIDVKSIFSKNTFNNLDIIHWRL
tara:strand:+ start:7449 stop:8738 length:1290 start_codon:yes stop_codon:yes gene_type:complete